MPRPESASQYAANPNMTKPSELTGVGGSWALQKIIYLINKSGPIDLWPQFTLNQNEILNGVPNSIDLSQLDKDQIKKGFKDIDQQLNQSKLRDFIRFVSAHMLTGEDPNSPTLATSFHHLSKNPEQILSLSDDKPLTQLKETLGEVNTKSFLIRYVTDRYAEEIARIATGNINFDPISVILMEPCELLRRKILSDGEPFKPETFIKYVENLLLRHFCLTKTADTGPKTKRGRPRKPPR